MPRPPSDPDKGFNPAATCAIEEGIEHDLAAIGEVEERILQHHGRLHRRMIVQAPTSVRSDGTCAGVAP
jgi:hypothetical protein